MSFYLSDYAGLDGAAAYDLPVSESVNPNSPTDSPPTDDELRKRRLQRFTNIEGD